MVAIRLPITVGMRSNSHNDVAIPEYALVADLQSERNVTLNHVADREREKIM